MLEYKLDCDENSNTNARTQVRAVGIEEIEEIKRKRDAGKKTTLAVLQRAVTSLLVDNPGRKFDLRVYVAVASWKPLVAFILPDLLYDLRIDRSRKVPKISVPQEPTQLKESTVLWRTKILRRSRIIVRLRLRINRNQSHSNTK